MFLHVCQPRPTDRVLDIGVPGARPFSEQLGEQGAEGFFEENYPWPDRVTGLAIDYPGAFRQRYPSMTAVQGDGCRLPFANKSYDLVFSNAVVEHVGGPEAQRAFVAECLRVARRWVFVAAPNRLFPVDMHLFQPIPVHWFPRAIYRRFVSGDPRLHLLDPWTFARLFPENVHPQRLSPLWVPSTVLVVRLDA